MSNKKNIWDVDREAVINERKDAAKHALASVSTWHALLDTALTANGESWDDVMGRKPDDESAYACLIPVDWDTANISICPVTPHITVWTREHIYKSSEYDGIYELECTGRNPPERQKTTIAKEQS
jgi:predicted metal-dependent enzyme (double-stranded beta helix superfamily)